MISTLHPVASLPSPSPTGLCFCAAASILKKNGACPKKKPCMRMKRASSSAILYHSRLRQHAGLLHVDDMLVLHCNDCYWDELKAYLAQVFLASSRRKGWSITQHWSARRPHHRGQAQIHRQARLQTSSKGASF